MKGGDNNISSISLSGITVEAIDFTTYGFNQANSELICVPGSTTSIILDRTDPNSLKYQVLLGNRIGNILDRFHSMDDLAKDNLLGYQFVSASPSKYGINVIFEKQSQNRAQRVVKTVFLGGPFAFYSADTSKACSKLYLVIAYTQKSSSGSYSALDIVDFDSNVVAKQKIYNSLDVGINLLDVTPNTFNNHVVDLKVMHGKKKEERIGFPSQF